LQISTCGKLLAQATTEPVQECFISLSICIADAVGVKALVAAAAAAAANDDDSEDSHNVTLEIQCAVLMTAYQKCAVYP